MRRRFPRPFADALAEARRRAEPATPLASAQTSWRAAVGERIAAVTAVTGERDGILTVTCEGAVWAEELSLMSADLLEALSAAMGDAAPKELRFEVGGGG